MHETPYRSQFPLLTPSRDINWYILHVFRLQFIICSCNDRLPPVRRYTQTQWKELRGFLKRGIRNISTDGAKGFWLHVDTKPVREDVARCTDELPLCLTPKIISGDMLSQYSKDLIQELNYKLPKNNKKLIACHEGQRNMLVALPFLQLLMELGLEVGRIHNVYCFSQSRYLQPFIQRNVDMRNKFSCKIRSTIFKAASNCISGKFLQSPTTYGESYYFVNNKKGLTTRFPCNKDVGINLHLHVITGKLCVCVCVCVCVWVCVCQREHSL